MVDIVFDGSITGGSLISDGILITTGDAAVSTNIGIGGSPLGNASQTGGNNIVIGSGTVMASATSAENNVFIGNTAGANATTALRNTVVGYLAGQGITTGARNLIAGANAGNTFASGAEATTTGDRNTFLGNRASGNTVGLDATIAIGADAVSTAATGATSGDDGPGISIGSGSYKVGFRGDGTIFPTAGTSQGYWMVRINGTQYKIDLLALA
jgi:hypothetical protein